MCEWVSEWVENGCERAVKRRQSGPQGQWGQGRQAQMKDNLWRSFTVGGEAPAEHTHSETLSLSLSLSLPRYAYTHKYTHTHTHYCTLQNHSLLLSLLLHPLPPSLPPSRPLSLPFSLFLKSNPALLFLVSFLSCSWISKETLLAEKSWMLAGRSLSQRVWDCGIPASHPLGTFFCPFWGPCHNC